MGGPVPEGRSALGDFTSAMRAAGLRSGFHYSLGEFNHPLYPKPEKLKPRGDMARFVGEWEFAEDAFEMSGVGP